jgi:hypothetical protein
MEIDQTTGTTTMVRGMNRRYRYALEYKGSNMREVGLPRSTMARAREDLADAKKTATIWGVQYSRAYIEVDESEATNLEA